MRKILSILLLCVLAVTASAVPARRGWQTRTQADGSTIEIQQVGDEFYHYMINRAGKEVREINGMYVEIGEAPSPEQAKARHAVAKARRAPLATGEAVFGYTPYLPPKGVVIMVNYSDLSFKSTTTKAVIDEMCNSENCTVNSYNGVNYGSIAQYFRDQSDGQYNLQLDVYGPVTLERGYAYYGQDYGGEGNDRYSGNVIIEACQKMDEEIDFSQYDWNNDGKVDFVYVVYAGLGQADGGNDNTIWPHSYDIQSAQTYGNCTYTEAQCTFDGKLVSAYAMSNELSGNAISGIGIICHEYGHVIGLVDHYDTDYSDNWNNRVTPNEWDIMDGGSYNGDLHCPPNYNAWEKAFCGWYTPTNLGTERQNLTIKPIGTTGYSAYQINASGTQQPVNTNGLNYYIECRNKQGWDTYIPANGLLIWKVNYNRSMWENNEPNLTSNGSPHFTIVPSSGTQIGEGYGSTNVWPYGNKTSWNGVSGKPLLNIAKSGDNITLTYIEEPTSEVDPFDITWKANGTEFATTTSTGTVVLPATNPLDCPCGKVFLGWTKTANYESETTAPTYVKAGDPIAEATTLYAVYAEQSGEGGAPQTTTYTFTSKAWADATNSWTSKADGYQYNTTNEGIQVTTATSGASAETKTAMSNVSNIVVTYCTNASKGVGSIKMSVGSTELSQDITKTGGITLRDLQFNFNNASGKVGIEVTCTTNSIYINSVAVTAGGGASYSDYSTACGCWYTDMDSIESSSENEGRLVLRNGQLLIIRGDAIYSITGARLQ